SDFGEDVLLFMAGVGGEQAKEATRERVAEVALDPGDGLVRRAGVHEALGLQSASQLVEHQTNALVDRPKEVLAIAHRFEVSIYLNFAAKDKPFERQVAAPSRPFSSGHAPKEPAAAGRVRTRVSDMAKPACR